MTTRRRLAARIAAGMAAGGLYAALDAYLDLTLASGAGARFASVTHEVVDFVLPVLSGAVMGYAVHALRLRADIATAERRRAEELRGSLQRIERDHAVFVIAASLLHELKNPLHALGLLLDEIGALPEDAGADRAALIARARAQADRVIAELAALRSLPASRTPELPRVDLGGALRRFAADLAPAGRIAVRGEGIVARADPLYLQIIADNLVRNALEAQRERGGGTIEIEAAREGDRAIVRVRDDGPGIAAEEAAAIFEPLRGTKERGMGLGLAIARALARAMEGDLRLESARPATFRLELSLSAEEEEDP